MAAEDPELNDDRAQDEQEALNEDVNNQVVGDRPEIKEGIDQEARPPVIVQPAVDQRDDIPARTDGRPSAIKPCFLKEEEV